MIVVVPDGPEAGPVLGFRILLDEIASRFGIGKLFTGWNMVGISGS